MIASMFSFLVTVFFYERICKGDIDIGQPSLQDVHIKCPTVFVVQNNLPFWIITLLKGMEGNPLF